MTVLATLRLPGLLVASAMLLALPAALAQQVSLAGSLGERLEGGGGLGRLDAMTVLAAPGVRGLLVASAMLLALPAALSQQVSLAGSMGERALLVIDGRPHTLAPGAVLQGVRLVSLHDGLAVVEIDGRRAELRVGAAPVDLGGTPSAGSGTRVVLSADSGGHFLSMGSINGRAVRFMVDTGATMVALGQAEAQRIGLSLRGARRGMVRTANGPVPAYRLFLDVVRVGDVQVYNVEAVVLPAAMPHVLLGNSFLARFRMQRENDRLVLDKRR